MSNFSPFGQFRGTSLIQTNGKIGGGRNVFVALDGNHDDFVYPPFGGIVKNPPKGRAKMWAGDLLEFRPTSTGLEPEIYILRTFKVVSAVSNTTTVKILRNEYAHKPFVGDVLMVAPSVIGGTGTAVTVTAISETTETVDSATVNVWSLTISAALTISAGAIMVEAEAAGSDKKMLVKRINGVFDCDADFQFDENIGGIGGTVSAGAVSSITDGNWEKGRYHYTPSLGGLMWIEKMSPLPQCVLDLNMCNVPGWFHVNYALNSASAVSNAAAITALTTRVAALEG